MTSPVVEHRWCHWCAETLPADHRCVGDGSAPPPCPSPEGEPCGLCDRCLAAQEADLVRHGSPSDLDVPGPDLRPVRKRALTYIQQGRAVVIWAIPHPADAVPLRPYIVHARVRGHRAVYMVRGEDDREFGRRYRWWCDCTPDPMPTVADQCPHAAAAAQEVGWPSAAGPLAHEQEPAPLTAESPRLAWRGPRTAHER